MNPKIDARWPNPALRGRSFSMMFVVYMVLFLASAVGGKWVDMPESVARTLLAIAGWVPFAVLLGTGYVIDGRWIAVHTCRERPGRYALSLALAVAVGGLFTYVALNAR